MNKTVLKMLATGALVAGAQQSQAASLEGTIAVGAFQSHVVIDTTANTVTFVDENAAPGNALVNSTSGDFDPFLLSVATYQNFTYSPLAVANPIWSLLVGGLSFDLGAITSIDEVGPIIGFTGVGIVHAAGYDDIAGTWSFSADTSNGGSTFSFSSTTSTISPTTTSTIPDGGATAGLLGLGIAGLALARRKME